MFFIFGPGPSDPTLFWYVFKDLVKVFLLAYLLRGSSDVFLLATYDGSAAEYWLELALYALYFYFNFSGYSDMAIGTARMFGFRLAPNFNNPYLKTNPQDFWNSWHMTLTQWIRSYFFNPFNRWLRGHDVGRQRAVRRQESIADIHVEHLAVVGHSRQLLVDRLEQVCRPDIAFLLARQQLLFGQSEDVGGRVNQAVVKEVLDLLQHWVGAAVGEDVAGQVRRPGDVRFAAQGLSSA